jgi:DNA-binding transcriptional regulator GbsR (MarR family)
MTSEYRTLRGQFIRLMERIAEERGFKPIHGRVLACLFLASSPLSQRAIADWTGYSVSGVSRVLDQLVTLGSVRRFKEPGNRYYSYEIGTSLSSLFIGAIERWLTVVQRAEIPIASLTEAADRVDFKKLAHTEQTEAEQMLRQLKQLRDTLQSVKALFEDLLNRLVALDRSKA